MLHILWWLESKAIYYTVRIYLKVTQSKDMPESSQPDEVPETLTKIKENLRRRAHD